MNVSEAFPQLLTKLSAEQGEYEDDRRLAARERLQKAVSNCAKIKLDAEIAATRSTLAIERNGSD